MTPLIILSILVLHSLNPTLGVFAENTKEVDDNSLVIENDAPSSGNDEATPIEDAFSSDSEEIEDNTLESDNNMPTDEGTTEDTTLETETDISTEGSATEDSTSETKTDILTDESETVESIQEETWKEDASANEEEIPLKERNLIFTIEPEDIVRTTDISSQEVLQDLAKLDDPSTKETDEVVLEEAMYQLVHAEDESEVTPEELKNMDLKSVGIKVKLLVEVPGNDEYQKATVKSKEFRVVPVQIFRIPDGNQLVTTDESKWVQVDKFEDIQPYDVIRGFIAGEDIIVIKKDTNDNLLVCGLQVTWGSIGDFNRSVFYLNDKQDDGYTNQGIKVATDNWYQNKVEGTEAESYVLPVEIRNPTLEDVLASPYSSGTNYANWSLGFDSDWSAAIAHADKSSVNKDWSTQVKADSSGSEKQAFVLSAQDIPDLGQANGNDWAPGTDGTFYGNGEEFRYKFLWNVKGTTEDMWLRSPGIHYNKGAYVHREILHIVTSGNVQDSRAITPALYININGMPKGRTLSFTKQPENIFKTIDISDQSVLASLGTVENTSDLTDKLDGATYHIVRVNDGTDVDLNSVQSMTFEDQSLEVKLIVDVPEGDGFEAASVESDSFFIEAFQIWRIPDSQDSNVTTDESTWTRVDNIEDVKAYDVLRGFIDDEDVMVIKKDKDDNLLVSSLTVADQGPFIDPTVRTTFYEDDLTSDGYSSSHLKMMIDTWYQNQVEGKKAENYVLPVEVKNPTLEDVLTNSFSSGTTYNTWDFGSSENWSDGIVHADKSSVNKDWSTQVKAGGSDSDKQGFALSVQDMLDLGQSDGSDWVLGTDGTYYRDPKNFQYKYLWNIKDTTGALSASSLWLRSPGSNSASAGIVYRADISVGSFNDVNNGARAAIGVMYINLDGVGTPTLKERKLSFTKQPESIFKTTDISDQSVLVSLGTVENTSSPTDNLDGVTYRIVRANDGTDVDLNSVQSMTFEDRSLEVKLIADVPEGDGFEAASVESDPFFIEAFQIWRIPDSQDSNVTTDESTWIRVDNVADVKAYDVLRGFIDDEDVMVIKKDKDNNLLVSSLTVAGKGAFGIRSTFYTDDMQDNGYSSSNLKTMIDGWYRNKVENTLAESYILPVEVSNPTLEDVLTNAFSSGTNYSNWSFSQSVSNWSGGIVHADKSSVNKDWSTQVKAGGADSDKHAFALSVQDIPDLGEPNGNDWASGGVGTYYRDNQNFRYKYLWNIKDTTGALQSDNIWLRSPGNSYNFVADVNRTRDYVNNINRVSMTQTAVSAIYINLDDIHITKPSDDEWIKVKIPTEMFFTVEEELTSPTDENIKSNTQTIENLSERSLNVSFNVDNDFSSVLNVHNIDFLSPDVTPNLGEEAMHLKLNLDKGDTPIYLHNNGGGIDESILFDPKEARTVSLGGAYFGDVPTKEQTAKEVTVQLTLHFEAGNDTGGGGTTPVKEGE
ncbi:MAG: hypothetical protein ACI32O_02985 [Enterococcus sp.]